MSPVHNPAGLQPILDGCLEKLTAHELAEYASGAMYTIGSVEDYKYFLPRLMELAVGAVIIEPWGIALKLRYGDWHEWLPEERAAVIDLFLEACIQASQQHTDKYLADLWFCGAAILGLDLQPIMQAWHSTASSNTALQLANLLMDRTLFKDNADKRGLWSYVDVHVLQSVRTWLLSDDVRRKLMAARAVTASRDIWMLDQALDEQDQLVRQRRQ